MTPQLKRFIQLLSENSLPYCSIPMAKAIYGVNITLREERMSPGMCKFHLIGLPFDAVLHHFTKAEDEFAHCHPFDFTSFILRGAYWEQEFYKSKLNSEWFSVKKLRLQGSNYFVPAEKIHKITHLENSECWTLILPERWKKEPGFYRFIDGKAEFKQWNENHWQDV